MKTALKIAHEYASNWLTSKYRENITLKDGKIDKSLFVNDFKSLAEKNNQAKTERERFGVCACVYGVYV